MPARNALPFSRRHLAHHCIEQCPNLHMYAKLYVDFSETSTHVSVVTDYAQCIHCVIVYNAQLCTLHDAVL